MEQTQDAQGSAADGLRTWLDDVAGFGGLQVVRGADWNLEIGALSELNYQKSPPSALLFDDIKDYPAGYRVLTGSMSDSRRLGYSLGLGPDLSNVELVEALRGKPNQWEAAAPDFPPVVVDNGPVLENVIKGDEVDLTMFPAPFWHEHDGGRFIGTGCIVFTSDPDTGQLNGGAYRMQLQEDGRSATVNIGAGKHGAQHIRQWFKQHGRAPITVSLGHHPVLLLVAGTEVPTGVSELSYAGAILGRPLTIIECPDTGLPIPSDSEIALSGWLYPGEEYDEGPYGEWTGYYTGGDRQVQAVRISRVYHRDAPVLLGTPPGKPPFDYSYMRTVIKSSMVFDALVKAGVPGVKGVWLPEAGGGRLFIVVSIEQRYCGHARQAGYIAAQSQASAYMNRYVVVVDDDIDPSRMDQVLWAMCTRSNPETDIDVMRRSWGARADPLQVEGTPPYNSRALIDACIPFERLNSFPRVATSSPELVARIRRDWADVLAFHPYGSGPG